MSERCSATSKDGSPCRGRARERGLCVFHDPELTEHLRESKSRGGKEKQRLYPQDSKVLPAATLTVVLDNGGPRAVIAVCQQVIRAIIEGALDYRIGSSVASLLHVAVSAMKVKETDRRLAELEHKTAALDGLTPEQLIAIVEKGQANGVAAAAGAGH